MRRRINTKFLVVFALSIGGIVLGVVGAKMFIFKDRPEPHIQMGELFMRDQKFIDAAKEFVIAAGLNPTDPELFVKTGDAMHEGTRLDTDLIGQDEVMWSKALEVDPRYLPALYRMLDAYVEKSQLWQAPELFNKVRDFASRVVQVKPDDLRCQILLQTSNISAWLGGMEVPYDQIEQNIKALTALMAKDPGNTDPPFYIARAKMNRAMEMQRQSRNVEAQKYLDEVATLFDQVTKQKTDDPIRYFRAAQIYALLAESSRDKPDVMASYVSKMREGMDRARAMVADKPNDPRYLEINHTAAKMAEREGQSVRAESIYRELLARRPDDQLVRLSLARLLAANPASREEAIRLLEMPMVGSAGLVGARMLYLKNMETDTLIQLANVRLDAYAASSDEAQKKALLTKIKENVQKVSNRMGNTPEVMKLQGKLQMAQGQYVDAIQTFNKGINLQAQSNQARDDEMYYLLARACIETEQSGQAKTILKELVMRHDKFLPARLLLTQILIRENALEEAKPHVRFLEKLLPNEPQVILLAIACMDRVNQKDEIKAYYDRLPEKDPSQMFVKARTAINLNYALEAERLLTGLHSTAPGDAQIAQLLSQFYTQSNRTELAKKVLNEALAANPSDKTLKWAKAQLEGVSTEAMMSGIEQDINAIDDEFTRETRLYQLASSQGKDAEALAHLKRAETLRPSAPQVQDFLFQYYLKAQNWDVAAQYMERLAKAGFDKAGGLLYRFRYAMARSQIADAISIGRELTYKLPEFSQSWLSLAQALQANGEYEQARGDYLRAIEKQSENMEALKGLIECNYALNRPADAAKLIASARTRWPNNTFFRNLEIDHDMNWGDPTKALPPLETMKAANPEQPRNWLILGSAYLRVAQIKSQKGEKDAAAYIQKGRDLYTEALAKWPDEQGIYAALANIAINTNQPAEAERLLLKFASRNTWSDKPEPYLMLASYYSRYQKFAQAESYMRQALAKSNNSVEVELQLSAFLTQIRHFDDAIRVLELNANDPRVGKQKIDILMAAGRYADAEKSLLLTQSKNPSDVDVLNLLTFIYISSGDFPSATKRIQQVLELSPDNSMALYYRALINLRQPIPEPDEALKDLATVRQKYPNNPDFLVACAEAYRQKNDLDNQIRSLENAMKNAVDNKAVRLKLIDAYRALNPPDLDRMQQLIEQAQAASQNPDPDWSYQAALMWQARANWQRAAAEIQQAMQLVPGNPNYIRAFLSILLDSGNYQPLLDATNKLLTQNKSQWWLYQMRALAKCKLNKKDEALADFESAVSAADLEHNDEASALVMQTIVRELGIDTVLPRITERAEKDNRWRMFAAYLHHSRGNSAEASRIIEATLNDAGKLAPWELDRALQLAGMIYMGTRPVPQVEKALQIYTQLLQRKPNDYIALNNMACLLAEYKNPPQPEEALQYSQRAFDLMQKSGSFEPLAMDTQGWTLTLAGHIDEGLLLLRQVVERKSFPEARYHLAIACLKKAYTAEAFKQLTEAKDTISKMEASNNPVDPDLKTKIDKAMEQIRKKFETSTQPTVP